MNLATVKDNIKNVGLAKALADIALRAVNRILVLKILTTIRIEAVDRAFLECKEGYRGMFLSEAMLREFAADPKNEITPAFLGEALAKGDQCYGFLVGNDLAAYSWYSTSATATEMPGLRVHFGDRYVYMYKGFTADSHRGQRLYPIGMTRALAACLARGFRGIVSYVEWNNFASLKSCYRMGYRDIGNIVIAGLRDRYVVHHQTGCLESGFSLKRTESPMAPATPLHSNHPAGS
jgi:hypothetical protein